jgi:hypothetical protein
MGQLALAAAPRGSCADHRFRLIFQWYSRSIEPEAHVAPRLLPFMAEAFIMKLKFAVPAFAILAGLLLNTSISFAKKEYTAKEKKGCIFCHKVAAPKDGKDLNAAGEYYKSHDHSLKGYQK